MQRVFSAKSPIAAQRACFSAATGILVLCVPLSFVALAAVSIVGDSAADARSSTFCWASTRRSGCRSLCSPVW